MYTQHWGLSKSPFTGHARGPLFHQSSGQREVLARVDYLIENGRRVGIFTGEDGFGKSTILEHLAKKVTRQGNVAISLNLLGVSESEFVVSLAQQLGFHAADTMPVSALWRGIFDRLVTNQYQQRATILLLDDVQDAHPDVLRAIGRISQWNPAHHTRVTILMATTPAGVARIGRRLLDLCDLRIELRPWTLEDTIGYVRSVVATVGGAPTIFDNGSLESLHQRSRGNPRLLRQLAELALVAGSAQQSKQIDADMVAVVDQELRMTFPSAAA